MTQDFLAGRLPVHQGEAPLSMSAIVACRYGEASLDRAIVGMGT